MNRFHTGALSFDVSEAPTAMSRKKAKEVERFLRSGSQGR
jgi:hypothetical protein